MALCPKRPDLLPRTRFIVRMKDDESLDGFSWRLTVVGSELIRKPSFATGSDASLLN